MGCAANRYAFFFFFLNNANVPKLHYGDDCIIV